METEAIQRTNMQYLGNEITQQRREYLEELNSRFDQKIKPNEEAQKNEQIEVIQEINKTEDKQKEPLKTLEDNVKLNQVMQNNAIQNIPTQEFLRIKGS